MPSRYPSALERLKWINQAVKSTRYSILFFGDSLTEGWDATVWERTLASRGALNAGVSGDRTDHLLWRLQHGNLAGPQPKAVVLLIGTNDLAYGRSPELTADGIRANLEMLRQRLPEARILLLGLLPREESPSAPLRLEVAQVNQLIRDCADGEHIFYAELGYALLAARLPTRILRYAAIVGREDVVAGTDCGLGGRVHADLAWAKLRTLVEGARLASRSLWP
jgi:lysophospholipase L1-like esterase